MDIKTLIETRKPGHALERPFYTSQDIFRLDLDAIFGNHWIYVGVEPDVAEPGDVMTVDIGSHAILIVRHDDMSVRAYHNACRHRGARLVDGPKGSVGNIVCRYHQWTYNLDGNLIFAEHMNPDFDRSCHGLKPVHLRSVSGLLFLCLSDTPPADIDDMERALTPYLERHDVRNTKVAAEIDLIEEGNWKVTMENNRECYHCAVSHPELTASLFEHGFGFAPDASDPQKLDAACRYDALATRMKAQWEQAGFPSSEIEHLADRTTGFPHRTAAVGRHGRIANPRYTVGQQKIARCHHESRARWPVDVDAAEFLAPFHGRPYRDLCGIPPLSRAHPAAHQMAGSQGCRGRP